MTASSASSWFSTPATRLGTVWKDWRRDPLVRLPQPAGQRDDQLLGHLGVLADQRAHVAGRQGEQLGVLGRLDAGRARLAVEHRELAEDRAGPEVGERDRPAVGVLAGHPAASVADDVAGVPGVALVEDAGVGRKAARDRDLGDALELGLGQLREQRHSPQQLDDAFASVGHGPIIPRLWWFGRT